MIPLSACHMPICPPNTRRKASAAPATTWVKRRARSCRSASGQSRTRRHWRQRGSKQPKR
jgi:hypothetical protein